MVLDYNAIQSEITLKLDVLLSGEYDVYEFIQYISEKYIKPFDKHYSDLIEDNPYLDLLFAMLEINKIYIY